MIFSENRCPLFRIMLQAIAFSNGGHAIALPASRFDGSGYDTALRSGVTFRWSWWSPMALAMKRAVIGVPS
jgi:hypothetical protein